jgi:hypothetical protein
MGIRVGFFVEEGMESKWKEADKTVCKSVSQNVSVGTDLNRIEHQQI